jgi:site-specific DNA-methyltransferase (adenine-specific)
MTSEAPSATVHQGDCLSVLPTLVSGGARFDLIYVDPPYNAGGKRGARVEQGERVHGPTAYEDHWGGRDAFISMLRPRLAEMRAALSSVGSLWVHLDHRTVHETKVLLDEIFGPQSFQGEVIWVPGNGGRKRRGLSVTHQTILVYSKTRDFIYNIHDPELREPYAETSQRMHFTQTDPSGRRYRERTLGGKTYRYFLDEGRQRGSVWTDIPAMSANTPLRRETTGYPTQKPVALLERIIKAASKPESLVLDPMCGSGTTLFAALRLGRNCVGIDQSPLACQITTRRIREFSTAGREEVHSGEAP